MMETQIVNSSVGLAELSAEWADLEGRSWAPSFYASADFVRSWWDAFGQNPDIDLLVVCARQNGRLVGLAPLALHTERGIVRPVRILRFTGRGDYLNFLIAEESSSQAVLKTLFRAIYTDIEWDTLSLTNVPGDSPLGNYLFKSELSKHFTFHIENPYIDLRRYQDFAEFVATSLPEKARKYRNKLQREIGFEFRVVQDDETIFARIADLHRLERDYLIDINNRTERHSLFDDPERRRHIERIFTTTNRPVTFVYVDDNDDLLAYRTCYRDGRTLLSWNSAYHPRVAQYRTGKALQYDIMHYLFETGDTDVFDLGAGRYPWKFEWTSDFRVTYRLQLTSSRSSPTSRRFRRPLGARTAEHVKTRTRPPNRTDRFANSARRWATSSSWRRHAPAPAKRALRSLRASARGAKVRVRRDLVAMRHNGFFSRSTVGRGGPAVDVVAATRPASTTLVPRSFETEPRPTIWYIPHPDDETIFMGGSIYANRSSQNVVVLLTRGGASRARDSVNARIDKPLDEAAFMHAREREFRAAIADLGVASDDVVVLNLPDGAVDTARVRAVVQDMERRLPGATHRTMTDLDPHPDHRAVGAAVRAAHRAGEISDCIFHLPYPLVDDDEIGGSVRFTADMIDAKRRALERYRRWDPNNGWYAIGSISVPLLLQQQLEDPQERVHRPPTVG